MRWGGRFGNRLLQYAYGATYARRTGAEYWLPSEWEGTRLFEAQPHAVVADEEIRRELALTDEWPAGNEARMEVVRRHLPDIELVDVEAEPEPYAARGRPWCHGNGCAFDRAVYSGLSRRHLRGLCEFSDEVKSLRCYQRYHDMQGLYDVAHLRRDISSRGQRPAMPVLVDTEARYPGRPVPPWPMAVPGREFQPPVGRGVARLVSDTATGRCAVCERAWPRRLDGHVISHNAGGARCEESGQPPAADLALASWLPVLPGLTPHGLRHGHQTWMDEDRIADVLKSERMGHEVPGMRGVYSHVSNAMRAELKAALQGRWTASLRDRAQLSPRSIVPVLDALLAEQRPTANKIGKIGSQIAPKIGHGSGPVEAED